MTARSANRTRQTVKEKRCKRHESAYRAPMFDTRTRKFNTVCSVSPFAEFCTNNGPHWSGNIAMLRTNQKLIAGSTNLRRYSIVCQQKSPHIRCCLDRPSHTEIECTIIHDQTTIMVPPFQFSRTKCRWSQISHCNSNLPHESVPGDIDTCDQAMRSLT